MAILTHIQTSRLPNPRALSSRLGREHRLHGSTMVARFGAHIAHIPHPHATRRSKEDRWLRHVTPHRRTWTLRKKREFTHEALMKPVVPGEPRPASSLDQPLGSQVGHGDPTSSAPWKKRNRPKPIGGQGVSLLNNTPT